jgi:hypothetical protein
MSAAVAVRVADVVVVESAEPCDGVLFLRVRLDGFDHASWFESYQALPRVVRYDGRLGVFVLTGWNSDSGTAYYKEAKAWEVARVAS